jgi:hypothetical protein
MANVLSPTMTVRDFENGYWYLDELKNFAEGYRLNRWREDQLTSGKRPQFRTSSGLPHGPMARQFPRSRADSVTPDPTWLILASV